MKLITSFAVPIAITKMQNCNELNVRLKKLFLEKEQQNARNKSRNSQHQKEVFESSFDLFDWKEPEIGQLKQFSFETLLGFIGQLTRKSREELAHWNVWADAWFHVTREGGYFTAHNHPNASWSAVYCVANSPAPAEKPESGVLRFLDYKANSTMYIDAANASLPEPFSIGNRVFHLEEGDFVIFPSYLLHEVAPYWGKSERITVAMNCWFKDRRIKYPG
ncbi:MAG: hypothetical protein HWE27_04770 [Gammaproteobacteria bacterium]|nr:hypothetical protein [Gammaproteobacteria bacterium]